jgi:hypothetical protein
MRKGAAAAAAAAAAAPEPADAAAADALSWPDAAADAQQAAPCADAASVAA